MYKIEDYTIIINDNKVAYKFNRNGNVFEIGRIDKETNTIYIKKWSEFFSNYFKSEGYNVTREYAKYILIEYCAGTEPYLSNSLEMNVKDVWSSKIITKEEIEEYESFEIIAESDDYNELLYHETKRIL